MADKIEIIFILFCVPPSPKSFKDQLKDMEQQGYSAVNANLK